jgi:4-hydroxybenzoate polyprenyltransferase
MKSHQYFEKQIRQSNVPKKKIGNKPPSIILETNLVSMIKSYFTLLRPSQWIKNMFVFAPLIFSQNLFNESYFVIAVRGFVSFCLISSSIYIINDIYDRESDKAHPIKRNRPIASNKVSVRSAVILCCSILLLTSLISLHLPKGFQGIIAGYFILHFLYSFKLKNIVILDVFIIASGFMLRVIGGAIVINVIISHWIILCTMFLSLFLATAKRRGELKLIQREQLATERKVLRQYDASFLDTTMVITASGMAISYALYTVADRTIKVFGTENLIFTTIFVLFGIFRYLFLVIKENKGENSVAIILKDVPMFVNLCLWFVTCVAIIYF